MSTAHEVVLKLQAGEARLAKLRAGWEEDMWREALARHCDRIVNPPLVQVFGPKRRRWDQYGAYHRRQVKKWLRRNRGIHALAGLFYTALATPDVKWFGIDPAAPGGDRTLYYGGGTGGGKTWRGEAL